MIRRLPMSVIVALAVTLVSAGRPRAGDAEVDASETVAAEPPLPSLVPPRPEGALAAPPLPPPAGPPFYTRWWFWTAVGVTAVGAVAVAYALGGPEPYAGTLAPGTIELRLR